MSSFANNVAAAYNQTSSANSQSTLQLTPDDITWNRGIFNEIITQNQQNKNWTVKMIQVIKLTEAMAVLEKKAEDMVNLANNINSTTVDLEAKAIITRAHNCISIAEQFHKISETLRATIHDILPQRLHAIQCDIIRELSYCQGNGNPQVDQHINRVQESFANTNYFTHPPMIPHTKKRDNDNIVMMPPTVSNSPIFIPPPIAKTQDSTSSNSSQPRTMIKVESPTPQQSDNLQFEVDRLAQYLKTRKALPWCRISQLLWKLWILQSCSWKTRHGSTISGTLKQERLILISLQTLIRSFIYPSEEQLLIVTFLVTGSNRLLTQSLFFLFINLPCNT